jgi:hypothetical protein
MQMSGSIGLRPIKTAELEPKPNLHAAWTLRARPRTQFIQYASESGRGLLGVLERHASQKTPSLGWSLHLQFEMLRSRLAAVQFRFFLGR